MMDVFNFTVDELGHVVQNYLIMCLGLALMVRYIQFLWKRRFLYIHSWKVEGPFSFPIIGSAYLAIGINANNLLDRMITAQNKMSTGLTRVWMGPKLVYFLLIPEHVETVLTHPKALDKDADIYKGLADLIGFGLITAPAKKWKHHRRVLSPAFNQRVLNSFVEVFAEKSIILADELRRVVGQKNFNLDIFSTRYTLDGICETAMGVTMNVQEKKGSFGNHLEKALEAANHRIYKLWYHSDWVWQFSSLRVSFEKYKAKVLSVIGNVISRKIAEQNTRMELDQHCLQAEIFEEPTYKRLAFLDLIMNGSGFTEKEIQEEVTVFIMAGTETTATSICTLFTMLGMHQEVQQKVYEEVMDILGPDRIVEAADLPNMKYTERVIKENLRLFPIAALIARSIEEDINLGDVILPAGCSVAIAPIYTHRDPKYWTDPLKFNPDRFLPEEVAKRHPCTYIPFSYGPRNCIGYKYAISSIKVVMATLIRQYRIFTEYKSVEEIQLKMNTLLKLADGSKVWIECR